MCLTNRMDIKLIKFIPFIVFFFMFIDYAKSLAGRPTNHERDMRKDFLMDQFTNILMDNTIIG